jgi:hypothetical protein
MRIEYQDKAERIGNNAVEARRVDPVKTTRAAREL